MLVHTPVLPVPLEGPLYFVSYGGAAFPDAVAVIKGYGITIESHGKTFINGKTGVTSATFESVPDVPFESIEVTVPAGPVQRVRREPAARQLELLRAEADDADPLQSPERHRNPQQRPRRRHRLQDADEKAEVGGRHEGLP